MLQRKIKKKFNGKYCAGIVVKNGKELTIIQIEVFQVVMLCSVE